MGSSPDTIHLSMVLSFAKCALVVLLATTTVFWSAVAQAEQVTLRHLSTVDTYGTNLRFVSPTAVFVDAKRQEVHVCDSGANRIITVRPGGEPLGYFSYRQKGQDVKAEPIGLAVNGGGTVSVADGAAGRVYEYDYRGEPKGYLSMPKGSSGYLPGKMALDAAGNLYVAIRNVGRVVVYDPAGRVKMEIGAEDSGGMRACCDVAVDNDGVVYALSPSGAAVHVFDKQGKRVSKFGSHEPGKAGFARPSGIDVDGKGRLWITDIARHTLRAFRPNGTLLAEFGGLGTGPGDFFSPADVCVDRDRNTLYVVEKSGHRLQAFAIEER